MQKSLLVKQKHDNVPGTKTRKSKVKLKKYLKNSFTNGKNKKSYEKSDKVEKYEERLENMKQLSKKRTSYGLITSKLKFFKNLKRRRSSLQ